VLARHFLRNANPLLELDASAIAALRQSRFAGNVRELQSLMTRLEICRHDGRARTIDGMCVARHLGESRSAQSDSTRDIVQDVFRAGAHLRLVMSAPSEDKRRAHS
jgi:transcriptional regulator with GAF, ATPase, and Fis domain